MRTKFSSIRIIGLAILGMTMLSPSLRAQVVAMPSTPPPTTPNTDSAIIFQPSEPLIKSANEAAREFPNSWGFNASFSDYGFGGGLFLEHTFSPDFTAGMLAEFGTAQGSREFDLVGTDKINRIFVIPIMAEVQYRLFRFGLSDNLRPYATIGAGPVVAMTTPFQTEFFAAFREASAKIIPGGFVGLGAKFGSDPKSSFGASLRYFIIPYPGELLSTTTQSLTNLSGLFLTVSYGFNF